MFFQDKRERGRRIIYFPNLLLKKKTWRELLSTPLIDNYCKPIRLRPNSTMP